MLENRIPFAPRLTNGASRPFQNSSRRNSTDGGRLSDSYASRRESSSSRESRLSVSSGGADRADESPPQNAGAKDPGPLPPIRKGPNKEFTFPTGDLTPIGELTPSGSPLPGGVPKDSPLGGGAKSRLPRPQEGGHSSAASTPNGHPQTDSPGSSSDAAGRGGTSSWKGFQIRGSAKIHPLGGDEEVAASTREGRGVEPHASPAGGGSKLLSLGRGTKSKLNFKELWRKAAHMAVQNKRMGKNAVKWTVRLPLSGLIFQRKDFCQEF